MPGENREEVISLPFRSLMILAVAITVILLDQLTKAIISGAISLSQSIAVIPGVFHLTLVHNRGAAFGILKGQSVFFIFSALISVILIFRSLKSKAGSFTYRLALTLILSGAVGNLVDRLRFGYVVDFIDFRIWPVFNVADSAITVGAVLLGWSIMKDMGKGVKRKKD